MKKTFSKILITVMVLALCLSLMVACQPDDPTPTPNPVPEIADNSEHFDEITRTLKLTKDYEGKSFFDDGIGVATLNRAVDGDTTSVKLVVDKKTVSIRYEQINTPESTGGVEKWGKAASLYNKEKLEGADLIVVEATKTPPAHDSYGTRYMGYIWYRTAGETDLKLLNLEMVENGFSPNNGQETPDYPYYSYFKKANDFARSIKLRLYSDLDDPLYDRNPKVTTIKHFCENIVNGDETNDGFNLEYYDAVLDSGKKVQFEGYLVSLKISDSGTHTFVAAQYDEETGKVYYINIYAAYSSSAASRMNVGDKYKIVGVVQYYYGTWQVSGIIYNAMRDGLDITYLNQSSYYLMFNSQEPNSSYDQYGKNLYSDVTVTEVSRQGNVLTVTGTANKVDGGKFNGEEAEFTFTIPVTDSYNDAIKVGSVISLTGLQQVKNSGQITVLSYSDITIR